MGYRFITNNHKRDVLDAWEVPPAVREEFDYLDWPAIEDGRDSASFVQYRGEWYDLGDVMRTDDDSELRKLGWDGFNSDSYFSGMAFRWIWDDEAYGEPPRIVIARVYAD